MFSRSAPMHPAKPKMNITPPTTTKSQTGSKPPKSVMEEMLDSTPCKGTETIWTDPRCIRLICTHSWSAFSPPPSKHRNQNRPSAVLPLCPREIKEGFCAKTDASCQFFCVETSPHQCEKALASSPARKWQELSLSTHLCWTNLTRGERGMNGEGRKSDKVHTEKLEVHKFRLSTDYRFPWVDESFTLFNLDVLALDGLDPAKCICIPQEQHLGGHCELQEAVRMQHFLSMQTPPWSQAVSRNVLSHSTQGNKTVTKNMFLAYSPIN